MESREVINMEPFALWATELEGTGERVVLRGIDLFPTAEVSAFRVNETAPLLTINALTQSICERTLAAIHIHRAGWCWTIQPKPSESVPFLVSNLLDLRVTHVGNAHLRLSPRAVPYILNRRSVDVPVFSPDWFGILALNTQIMNQGAYPGRLIAFSQSNAIVQNGDVMSQRAGGEVAGTLMLSDT